jgi:hypothetical protein
MMAIKYEMLHELYLSRPTARELFCAIVEAGVEAGRTTVDELIETSSATRRQAITLLRDLEEARCGEFKVGRKGHPSRLVWSSDPVEIAKRVISRGEAASATPDHEDVEQPSEPEPESESEPYAQDVLEATQAALDLADSTAEDDQVAPDRKTKRGRGSAKRGRARGELIEHTYVLRPNTRVSVTLPQDLTRREAEVLADWIRNLSFER